MLFFLSCTATNIDSSEPETLTSSSTESAVQAHLSTHIPTVVNVDITLQKDGTARLTAMHEQTLLSSKPIYIPAQGSVTIPFLGLPQDYDATLSIELKYDDQTEEFHTINIQTGSFSLPTPTLEIVDTSPDPVGYFMGTVFGEPERLLIFDRAGNIVWQRRQYDEEHGGIDSHISNDQRAIFFNRFSKDKSIDSGHIEKIALDGTPIKSIRTPMAHHVFTQTDTQTLAYIALDPRETDEYGMVCGDSIIEIDQDSATSILYTTWDDIPLYESEYFSSTFYPQGHDWTHTNFLSYNASRDSFLISMASTNMILELDRAGNVLKKIGGQGARGFDYSVDQPSDIFAYPHAPTFNPAGDLMLMSTMGERSSVIAYSIDEDTKKLHKVWEHGKDYSYNVRHLGQIISVPPYRFVNWGSVGHMELLNQQAEVVWEAYTPLSYWFAQFQYLKHLPGMEPPQ